MNIFLEITSHRRVDMLLDKGIFLNFSTITFSLGLSNKTSQVAVMQSLTTSVIVNGNIFFATIQNTLNEASVHFSSSELRWLKH
jgi:hypothetical protein